MKRTVIISMVFALVLGTAWAADAGQVEPLQMKRLERGTAVEVKPVMERQIAPIKQTQLEGVPYMTPGQTALQGILNQHDMDADTILDSQDQCDDSFYQLIRLHSIPSGNSPTETIVDGVRLKYSGYTYNPPNYIWASIMYPDGAYAQSYTQTGIIELAAPGAAKIINAGEVVHIKGTNKYMRWLYADNDAVDLLITDAVPIPEVWYQYQHVMARYWQLMPLLTQATVQAVNVPVGCTIPYNAIYPLVK